MKKNMNIDEKLNHNTAVLVMGLERKGWHWRGETPLSAVCGFSATAVIEQGEKKYFTIQDVNDLRGWLYMFYLHGLALLLAVDRVLLIVFFNLVSLFKKLGYYMNRDFYIASRMEQDAENMGAGTK
jgi:hypothetical protein